MVRSTERSMPVPYKMSRDTRPRVSAGSGRTARTPREGCPYDVNVYAPFCRNTEVFLVRPAERSMPVPYITLFGNRTPGGSQIIGCNLSHTRL